MQKVNVGDYVHHEISKPAFFKVVKAENKIATILQIDNLGTLESVGKLIYNVPFRELKRDYIK